MRFFFASNHFKQCFRNPTPIRPRFTFSKSVIQHKRCFGWENSFKASCWKLASESHKYKRIPRSFWKRRKTQANRKVSFRRLDMEHRIQLSIRTQKPTFRQIQKHTFNGRYWWKNNCQRRGRLLCYLKYMPIQFQNRNIRRMQTTQNIRFKNYSQHRSLTRTRSKTTRIPDHRRVKNASALGKTCSKLNEPNREKTATSNPKLARSTDSKIPPLSPLFSWVLQKRGLRHSRHRNLGAFRATHNSFGYR